MNSRIEKLNKKLASLEEKRSLFEQKLQEEYDSVFDDLPSIKDAISRLNMSYNYIHNREGEICSWVPFDFAPFRSCIKYFKDYMQDTHFIQIDANFADTLYMSHGPALVIDDDCGDVYDQDSGETVIYAENCVDKEGNFSVEKRNKLIKEYMEKTGRFPGVYQVDRYNNIFLVNTQKKK